MALVIGASLMLSFGIGMLSGGLQHFDDFPDRGAVLVPLGIVVSFVAFVVKDAETPARRMVGPMGLVVLMIALVSFFGLRQTASTTGGAPGRTVTATVAAPPGPPRTSTAKRRSTSRGSLGGDRPGRLLAAELRCGRRGSARR